ncbi:nonsense-mediated mRNA decay protein [Skeletonema marinoi]|uniref:Nonsense-mediated mRNA decay protein n=1 Tax=Skeletonema marinoi TaxID=267567 RepID=A0AAD9DHZ1_9STRA|nr:nonsense-mediated mRNA decay protein [Skeletonema marinoi]
MSGEVEDTLPMVEEEAEEDENEDGEEEATEEIKGENTDEENKDTPHYKLMVLLEQELPEASRREKIDEIADRFCANHGSNKKSRKRFDHGQGYSDSTLVTELEQQFHGQARFKKNQNIESRLRTARYIGELTKFRVAPPIVALRGIKRCLEDFSGYNIDVACCLLESCGRYLFRTKHTHKKIAELMDTMMRLKKARNLDERSIAMINSAFFMVNPPPQSNRPVKEVPPLEAYLRYLLASTLEADDKSVSFVSKQIQRLPWSDPSIDCGGLVCKFMLKACRKGRYKTTKAVASLVANLKRSKPEVPSRLIDAILEDIDWFLENPNFRDNQRTIVCARLFGELYCSGVLPSSIIFEQIDHILNFQHDIPDALRDASQTKCLHPGVKFLKLFSKTKS